MWGRGLDVQQVSLVICYDLPNNRELLTCLDRFKRIRKEFKKNLKKSLDFTNISDFLKDFIGP